MGIRRRSREYTLQMLYAMDITQYLPQQIFSGFKITQDLNKEAFHKAQNLVLGVSQNLSEIDAVISEFAEHWKIHRMAVVDRNLLRLSIYELLFLPNIPFPIIINEALEIVKEFSDCDSTQFINGILDAASKKIRMSNNLIK